MEIIEAIFSIIEGFFMLISLMIEHPIFSLILLGIGLTVALFVGVFL